jgi:TetR/AcrR family acrAB operon transcriptional repressor
MVRKTKEEAEQTRKDILNAARIVFHECGVSRSSLEKIAKAAGVTRGAVYWDFKDKAELFFAMREEVFVPMLGRTDAILYDPNHANPLDAIEGSIAEFFRVLEDSLQFREVFEVMISRCEYVEEFASVQQEVGRPAQDFIEKILRMYRLAAEKGYLRAGIAPEAAARDTWAFTSGLLHLMLGCRKGTGLEQEIPGMIAAHMAMRR